MAVIVRNYIVERGIQFRREILLEEGTPLAPTDLTGASVRADIRESQFPEDISRLPAGTGILAACAFDVELADDLTTGIFDLVLPINKTLLLRRGDYEYDVVVTFDNGDKRRLLTGLLTVIEIVSQP